MQEKRSSKFNFFSPTDYRYSVEDEEKSIVYKCDYCRGIEQPGCVSACPTKAIYFCEPEEFKNVLKIIGV